MADPLPISEGEQSLHDLLRRRGVDPVSPRSVGETWEVFKEFLGAPFDTSGPDSDGVLYQVGTFDVNEQQEFFLDFVRQFWVSDADGEHDHYEQLHCEFRFPISAETESYQRFHAWWFAGDRSAPWSDFAAMVERRPEFVALRSVPPLAAKVEQEKV